MVMVQSYTKGHRHENNVKWRDLSKIKGESRALFIYLFPISKIPQKSVSTDRNIAIIPILQIRRVPGILPVGVLKDSL